jgi:magnesium chelatase subunit D
MNPEEGELRPQLLDRFGLTVDVHASRDVDVRVQVIRQRMAYEADPDGFAERYAAADAELARRIAAARALVDDVVLPDNELRRIAALCAAFDVDGMRADLVVARTAVAHAAWRGAHTVEEQDIRVAAELALPHRRRRDPFDDPGIDRDQLDEALAQAGSDPDPEPDPPGGQSTDTGQDAPQQNSGERPTAPPPKTKPSAPPSKTFRTRTLRVPGVGEGAPGRRSRARNASGSVIAAADGDDTSCGGHGLHLFATLLSAAERAGAGPLRPGPDDVRRAVREGREGNLVIFVVDASGSMAARDRMAAVSGATLSLLRDAYQRRDKVAVITFRHQEARLLLPPTSSAHIAGRRLARFDTGGKTPLAEGLLAARELIVRETARDRSRRPLVVVLTDGRATAGPDPLGRTRSAAARLVAEGAAAVVVDCETSYVRLGLAEQLARHLGAPSVRLEQLHADSLTRAVRDVA